jgi:hypothetical protein
MAVDPAQPVRKHFRRRLEPHDPRAFQSLPRAPHVGQGPATTRQHARSPVQELPQEHPLALSEERLSSRTNRSGRRLAEPLLEGIVEVDEWA